MFRPFGTPSGPAAPFGTPQAAPQAAQPQATGLFSSTAFGAAQSQPYGGGFGNNPRYAVTTDVDNNVTISLQTITAMPAYQAKSLEELRLEDYAAGRKGGSAPFAGSTSTTFGAAPPVGGGLFGATTPALPKTGGFGTTTGAFGGSSGGGLFGQQQPAQPSFSSSGGTLFGQQQQQQQQQQQPSLGFGGAFGQQQPPSQPQQAQPAGLFGAAPTTTGGGLFGSTIQPQQQQQPTTGGGFSTFGKPAATGGGLFGGAFGQQQQQLQLQQQQQQQLQQQQQPSTGLFGATTTQQQPATGGGLFGRPATTTGAFGTTGSAGGIFGGGGATTAGAFGATPAAPTTSGVTAFSTGPTTTGFGIAPTAQPIMGGGGGLFGQQATQLTAQQPTTGFSFGGGATQTMPSTGFSFGATQPQQSQQIQPQAQPTTSGFSFNLGQSATQPSFAAAAPPPPSSFSFGGATQPTQQPTTTGGGFNFNLGGGAAAAPALNMPLQTQQPFQLQQQPLSLVPATNLPVVSAESLSIKPPLPAALMTPQASAHPVTKGGTGRSATSRSPARFTPRATFRLQPPSEVSSASVPSGSLVTATGFVLPRRVSAKKLVVTPAEVVTSGHGRLATLSRMESTIGEHASAEVVPGDEHYGETFMIPDEATLRRLPYAKLSAVHNFTVGARGIGQVRFLQPVDLTKLNVEDIFGRIVRFESCLVSVYPEEEFPEGEEGGKPDIGSGLNLPAEIRLERCWAPSKANREPIKDMNDARLKAHIERLRGTEDTQFIDYYPETGTWIFQVEHFSIYSLAQVYSPHRVSATTLPRASRHADTSAEQTRTLEHARRLFHGTGRRFGLCWLPDGAGLVSRFGVASVWTIITPVVKANADGVARVLSDKGNNVAVDGDLDTLIQSLVSEDEGAIKNWLLARVLRLRMPDRLVTAICRGDFPSPSELIIACHLDRLRVMSSLRPDSAQYPHSLSTMAAVQLELLPADAPLAERLVLSLLSGQPSNLDGLLPWEAVLHATMCYPQRTSAQAISISNFQDDIAWLILAFHHTGRAEYLQRALYPRDLDYSQPFIIAKLLSLPSDDGNSRVANTLHTVKVGLAGQLLAGGEWGLAGRIVALDVGPFVRLDCELQDLMTPTQRRHYHQQELYCTAADILTLAKADRCGCLGHRSRQVRLLIGACRYAEAQRAATPLAVEAIINGQDPDGLYDLLSSIPAVHHCDWTLVYVLYAPWRLGAPLIDPQLDLLTRTLVTLQIRSLRERVAVAEVVTRLTLIRADARLFGLLPQDQRLALLHRLIQ